MAPKRRGGGGGLSRRAALALIGGGGLLGISSTGAFDQVRGQRPFDLSVNDDNALLGIAVFTPIEINSSPATVDILELQNRFPDAELTELTISSDNTILSVESLDGLTLQPGETETVRGTISVSESGQSVVNLTVTATTGTERIETTRSIEITATVAGYEPGTCPVSVNVGADALPEQESEGSITVVDQDVADGIDAGGSVTITGIGNRPVIIGGDVEAEGSISIAANGRNTTVIIDGDVEAGGAIDISASGNVTIGGDVEAEGDITIAANGNGTITICGSVESDNGDLTTTENGANASVTINGDDGDDDDDDGDDDDGDNEDDDDGDDDDEDNGPPGQGRGPPGQR